MTDQPKYSIDEMQDADFWRVLCPSLSISEEPLVNQALLSTGLRDADWETCKTLINEDGYFSYDSLFETEDMDQLSNCFEVLKERGIHPVFAFVFDEFWKLPMALDAMFVDLIGDHLVLPAVWSWHVGNQNQTGFSPHRDQVREVGIDDEDHLDYLTIWIPLTDLNHLSSSICVLPASLDPDYEDGTPEIRVENLQDIRSLQGSRGSVFCWTTQLAHWGTSQSDHATPRKSVGYYIQKADAECIDGPPIDFTKPLTLKRRLAIIGQQIIDYSRTAGDDELKFASELVALDENNQPAQ